MTAAGSLLTVQNTYSISEIVETIGENGSEVQICAAADADYDPAAQKVSVLLRSFARRACVASEEAGVPKPWLPSSQRVAEHLPRSDAAAFTRDVFATWVAKVRASIPHNPPAGPVRSTG